MAPASIGFIIGASKFWDAVSDPLAGYLSDRTRSGLGRRRPWLLASVLPLCVVPAMAWSPPVELAGSSLLVWMTVAVFGFFTATTLFGVPHASLGAELTLGHHERTRLFAFRHVGWNLGMVVALVAVAVLIDAENKRETARWLAVAGGAATAVLVLYAVARLRERSDFQGRGGSHPRRAFRDVAQNPHARLLLFVYFIENLGMASLAALGPYVVQYIIGDESMFPVLVLSYLVPTLACVPFGLPLARKIGKKNLWLASMVVSGASYGCLFFAGPGDYLYICACGAGAGIGSGFGAMVGPSVQSDVIDYDEYATGERKEGAYFAAWSFVFKCSFGLMTMATGFALSLFGFEPNVEQTETAKLALRVLFSLLPLFSYLIGALVFLRFRLTETEHRRIRAALDARALRERE
jgi:GPH family glycoside/pentoside/hexuronide:cation symporter